MRVNQEASCQGIMTHSAALAETARQAAGDLPVPTCPGWSLLKLLKHAGTVARWAERMVATRAQQQVDSRQLDLELPPDEAGYPNWLAATGRAVARTFQEVDPATRVWTWGAAQNAGFWMDRVLFEMIVHRADAELALAIKPAIDADLAVLGIDEFLDNLPYECPFAPHVANLVGSGETLHLHATDRPAEWTIQLNAEGFSWRREHAKATAAVRAGCGDLLLLLYGRRKPAEDCFERFGDGALLERWLANSSL